MSKFAHLTEFLADTESMPHSQIPSEPPLRLRAWVALTPGSVALALAFVGVVAAGRMLSAKPANAKPQVVSTTNMENLPELPQEPGVTHLLTLVGNDTIVRIGVANGHRSYSVFNRSGVPVATCLSGLEFARTFPHLRLESMRDFASGRKAVGPLLADTPEAAE